MEYLILGTVVAINFIVIKIKAARKRYEDVVFDVSIFAIIMALFAGSFAGLIVGSIASMIMSLYFFASPPTFFTTRIIRVKKWLSTR